MFSFLSSFFGADAPELSRVGSVPAFSRLAIAAEALGELPQETASSLAELIVEITGVPGAAFVSPAAFAGHEAGDSEFYPDSGGWAFIRESDRAGTAEVDFSRASPSDLESPAVREALLTLLAYPSVVRIVV